MEVSRFEDDCGRCNKIIGLLNKKPMAKEMNLTNANMLIEAVVSQTKERLGKEIDVQIEEMVTRMKGRKVALLAEISLVIEKKVRVDQFGSEILFIVKE